jgi:hypothetical protein
MKLTFIVILLSLLLVACGPQAEATIGSSQQSVQMREDGAAQESSVRNPDPSPELSEPVLETAPVETTNRNHWPDGEVRSDEQGFVEVAISPINLNSPTTSLNFEVSLNTHSVDLSMDLASLATLDADNGMSVNASVWDAPSGGHHVSGMLTFPADVDGSAFLDDATRLTLTIWDVDAPERVFVWKASE